MKQLKRQHSCLTLRIITSNYNIPLGVWVCREAARRSTQAKPIKFDSEKLMLDYAHSFIKTKFNVDISQFLEQSKLLKEKKNQTKLTTF